MSDYSKLYNMLNVNIIMSSFTRNPITDNFLFMLSSGAIYYLTPNELNNNVFQPILLQISSNYTTFCVGNDIINNDVKIFVYLTDEINTLCKYVGTYVNGVLTFDNPIITTFNKISLLSCNGSGKTVQFFEPQPMVSYYSVDYGLTFTNITIYPKTGAYDGGTNKAVMNEMSNISLNGTTLCFLQMLNNDGKYYFTFTTNGWTYYNQNPAPITNKNANKKISSLKVIGNKQDNYYYVYYVTNDKLLSYVYLLKYTYNAYGGSNLYYDLETNIIQNNLLSISSTSNRLINVITSSGSIGYYYYNDNVGTNTTKIYQTSFKKQFNIIDTSYDNNFKTLMIDNFCYLLKGNDTIKTIQCREYLKNITKMKTCNDILYVLSNDKLYYNQNDFIQLSESYADFCIGDAYIYLSNNIHLTILKYHNTQLNNSTQTNSSIQIDNSVTFNVNNITLLNCSQNGSYMSYVIYNILYYSNDGYQTVNNISFNNEISNNVIGDTYNFIKEGNNTWNLLFDGTLNNRGSIIDNIVNAIIINNILYYVTNKNNDDNIITDNGNIKTNICGFKLNKLFYNNNSIYILTNNGDYGCYYEYVNDQIIKYKTNNSAQYNDIIICLDTVYLLIGNDVISGIIF